MAAKKPNPFVKGKKSDENVKGNLKPKGKAPKKGKK